jgi:hypothetical protein
METIFYGFDNNFYEYEKKNLFKNNCTWPENEIYVDKDEINEKNEKIEKFFFKENQIFLEICCVKNFKLRKDMFAVENTIFHFSIKNKFDIEENENKIEKEIELLFFTNKSMEKVI